MAKRKQVVRDNITRLTERWRTDLRELFSNITRDPLARDHGRRWERDFTGEVDTDDAWYAVFLVVMGLIPAAVVAYVSTAPAWRVLAQFFAAPLHTVINGFLTAVLIFLGSHVNRVPKPWPIAFKLMLRVMSIYPLLGFLLFIPGGQVLVLLVYGLFVIRGVRKTYPISVQNVLLFFGIAYGVFALLQLQALIRPPASDPLRNFSMANPTTQSRLSSLSKGTIFTSSSSSIPS